MIIPAPRASFLVWILAMGAGGANGEGTPHRDPTQPPQGYGAPAAVVQKDPTEAFKPEHLVMVDGQRYLMWQGKRYRVGDTLQGARIERIEESEVWLRNDRGLRKLSLYPRIEKRLTTTKGQE